MLVARRSHAIFQKRNENEASAERNSREQLLKSREAASGHALHARRGHRAREFPHPSSYPRQAEGSWHGPPPAAVQGSGSACARGSGSDASSPHGPCPDHHGPAHGLVHGPSHGHDHSLCPSRSGDEGCGIAHDPDEEGATAGQSARRRREGSSPTAVDIVSHG